MPSKRSILLGAIGLAVLLGIVVLAFEVTDSPAVEIDEAKLREAQASYRRMQAARERAEPPRLPEPAPIPRPARHEEEEEEPEPASNLTAERRDRPRTLRLPPGREANVAQVVGAGAGGLGGGSLKQRMDEANDAYDRARYETARERAIEVLEDHPKQVRMLRVVVSTSCIMGDHDTATEYFDRLERDRDRKQMARRCKRYGVDLAE